MKVYAVTTINSTNPTTEFRCVGVFSTIEKAKEVVEANECDIHENYYDYVVIEAKEVDSLYGGFFFQKRHERWYHWEDKYVSVQKPKEYKNIVGWGIG
jgi:hypothetical protein